MGVIYSLTNSRQEDASHCRLLLGLGRRLKASAPFLGTRIGLGALLMRALYQLDTHFLPI